ncbi:Uncharacterized protein BM_BM18155 [Brugia malayi]|uniref:Uncharacterized protein n=1 Tax=Brugia malayi TaxID=6279 RepID=A0A4E9EUL9_BRUMA|nr:Uncharacterized protein BM_BM18155 [Brugia malayi]VIO87314.1 Uncharacterized protein BM_BM18155 [Brugia malayi]
MADEALMKAGLYLDAFSKIRLLQPGIADVSNELVEEAKEIVNKLNTFNDATEAIIKAFDGVRLRQNYYISCVMECSEML